MSREERDADAGPLSGAADLRDPLHRLFRQVQIASSRVRALRAPEALGSPEDLVQSAFQELDCAHEELRSAEEYVHAQAEALARTQAKLEGELFRYRHLFEDAPEPYLLSDLRGRILAANRCAAALLNVDAAFLPGKPLVTFIARDDRTSWHHVLELLETKDQPDSLDMRLQPRGAATPISTTLLVSRGHAQSGAPIDLLWMIRASDQTERTRVRKRVVQTDTLTPSRELADIQYLLDRCLLREQSVRQRADRLIQRQGQLMLEVAHELCSPLTALAGWVEVLGSNASTLTRDAALASMAQCITLMRRTVVDVADYARGSAGPARLASNDVCLAKLLEQASADCTRVAAFRDVAMVVEPVDQSNMLRGDTGRLLHAFTNLILHVVKRTLPGGVVHVRARTDHTEIRVIVTGSALAESSSTADDEPRQRLAATFRPAIGLEVARQLVGVHGGSLIEDESQATSPRITATLPLAAEFGASPTCPSSREVK